MISLFNIPNYTVDTSCFENMLHGKIVTKFEENFAEYVGAKYACSLNSATNAILLSLYGLNTEISIPSIMAPVVANAILHSGNTIKFTDDINWVGSSYTLHTTKDYKIIDSAQQVERNQFQTDANDDDLMIFSFYPTKPVSGIDGGMIVSNNQSKIEWFKIASLNGMEFAENNWDRKIKFPGWKMYMNSFQAYIANKNLETLDIKKEKLDNVRLKYNAHFSPRSKGYHLYRIGVENNDHFIAYMKNNNIQCGKHYNALHKTQVFHCNQSLPLADCVDKTTVSIPFHENLSIKDIDYIIKKHEDYINTNK